MSSLATNPSLSRRNLLAFSGLAAGSLLLPKFAFARDGERFQGNTLKLEVLTDSISVLSGAGGNISILHGPDGSFVFDSGLPQNAADVWKSVRSVGPIKTLINTHFHFDHVGGNETFGKEGVLIVSHENTRARLTTKQVNKSLGVTTERYPDRALPLVTFKDSLTLEGNGQVVHLNYFENAHTDTDIITHLPNSNIVVTGDLFFNGIYPFIDPGAKGWIGGMVAASEKILSMTDEKTRIVPGHGPIATPADLRKSRDMLATIQANIEGGLKAGKSADEIVASKPTKAFDEQFGKGFLPPDAFVKIVLAGFEARRS